VVVACRFILDIVEGQPEIIIPRRKRQAACPESECLAEFCWLVWAVPINLADDTLLFAEAVRSEPKPLTEPEQSNSNELVDMTVDRDGFVYVMERRVVPASTAGERDEEFQTRIWSIQFERKFCVVDCACIPVA
jgi:hypothetical protein